MSPRSANRDLLTNAGAPGIGGEYEITAQRAAGGLRPSLATYPGLVRVVSLLPSATEIVYALGLGEDLVGVTFECDEPAAARSEKTVVVGGRDTGGMTPGEIDSYVRAQLAAGADLYTLQAEALARLEP